MQEGRCPQGLLDAASGSGSSDVPPEPPFFPVDPQLFPHFLIACFAMLFAQLKDVAPSR